MNTIVIVLTEDGTFESSYSDSEVEVKVLRRGRDDRAIDAAENTLEEIT